MAPEEVGSLSDTLQIESPFLRRGRIEPDAPVLD